MMPPEGDRTLDDLAFDLIAKASALSGQLNPLVRDSLGDLVRSMNCYYSNLIEGHNTHPRDIERALATDFSSDLEKRNLQLEAKAHIEVQQLIDRSETPQPTTSSEFIRWLHREFCDRLPPELLVVTSPDGSVRQSVQPGAFRTGNVQIGKHVPPSAAVIPLFLQRFSEAYDPERLSKYRQIIAIAASHHRLLWIHPFYDGNGRVTRLMSHAFLQQLGVGSSLWSVSRGLARRSREYKSLLQDADAPRHDDLDGRGNLTLRGLKRFCQFFLEVCIDQVEFMGSLLEAETFLRRLELFIAEEVEAGRLLKGSYFLLREVWMRGEMGRGQAGALTGYKDRQARSVLSRLVKRGLLVSDSAKGAVRLGFPLDMVERCFPNLYPQQG
ncbi:MAG: Fic family protein [Cyanobacteria bacterium P01_F01_bin.33]